MQADVLSSYASKNSGLMKLSTAKIPVITWGFLTVIQQMAGTLFMVLQSRRTW
jgi:hypothetical protein